MATSLVWTMDDVGAGGTDMVEAMQRTCAFWESRGVRATLFVVPKPNGATMSPEWVNALREARAHGHDLQLHGLTHEDCFEFGPPNWPATDIVPSFITEFESRREELMPRYTEQRLRARIEEGVALMQEYFGVQPKVFRAPCGAISKPLFRALAQAGIHYDTSMFISGSGYEHLPHRSGVVGQKWVTDIPYTPFRWYSGVVEIPILNEYTWRGAWQREDEFIALAREDVRRIARESDVAVLLTHGVGDNLDYAFRLIDAVIDHVHTGDLGHFSTLAELVADGRVEQAAQGEGPDILSV